MTPQQLAHSITVLFRGEKPETIEQAINIVIREQNLNPINLPSHILHNQSKTQKQ